MPKKWGMDRRALANAARRAGESYSRGSLLAPTLRGGRVGPHGPPGRPPRSSLEALTATGEASS